MHAPPELFALVGPRTFEAGLAYARQGRASVAHLDAAEGYLAGTCQGSGGNRYRTQVFWEETRNGVISSIDGVCSCPVRIDCKHAVALLITGLDSLAGPAPAPRPSDWQPVLAEIFPRPLASAAPLGLAVRLRPPLPASPASSEWSYADLDDPGELAIRPLSRGKRGQWISSKSTWTKVRRHDVPDADPTHVAMLNRLCDLCAPSDAYQFSYYGRTEPTWLSLHDCPSPLMWPLLRELAASGVELVDDDGHRPVRLVATPATAQMSLRVLPEGDLRLAAVLHHPDDIGPDPLFIGAPAHGVAWRTDDGIQLAELDPPASDPWMRLHDSGPVTVPAADRGVFERDVVPHLARQQWFSPDDSYRPTPPPPPGLHLDLDVDPVSDVGQVPNGRLRWSIHYRQEDGTGHGPLSLARRASDPPRDADAETGLLSRAAAACAPLPTLLHRAELREQASLSGMAVITFLEDVLPQLSEAGVVVHHTELPEFRDAGPAQVQVAITQEGRDWFDLEVTMTVAGHDVPIGQVITALASRHDTLFLPDGSYVSLDDPELQHLRELLAESRALTDQRRTGVRVSKLQSSWWEELLALGVVQASEHAWLTALRHAVEHPPEPAPLPAGLRAELRPYQQDGFAWLAGLRRSGLGGVLADDMGLGKTVQTLAMILDERENPGDHSPGGPWLVVAPTSVVPNWAAEAEKFAPGLRVATVTATRARRHAPLADAVADADVVVTSYALLRLDIEEYQALRPLGLVLDEAQNVKNHQSKAFASAKKVGAAFTYAITGTPMENNLGELWAMFALTAPGLLGTPAQFGELYRKPIERDSHHSSELLTRLRRRIAPFLLRRVKEQVALDLPAKQEQLLEVDLLPAHRRVYDRHLQRERRRVLHLAEDLEQNRVEVLSALTRLRQLAIDASLVDPDAGADSSKLEVMVPLLTEAAAEGHRVLVFSQFTRYLRIIGDRLTEAGLGYSYLDGATRNRAGVIRGFAEGDDPVFLISLKAGGAGLNLTMADYAIIADPWWNPATEAQAVDRTHRIGQTRPVMVYRLVAKDTIEQKVMALQKSKRTLMLGVLGDDEDSVVSSGTRDLVTADVPVSAPGRARRIGGAALTTEDLHLLLA